MCRKQADLLPTTAQRRPCGDGGAPYRRGQTGRIVSLGLLRIGKRGAPSEGMLISATEGSVQGSAGLFLERGSEFGLSPCVGSS